MSEQDQRAAMAKKTVVYEIDGMERVHLRKNIEYRTTEADALTMDLYSPPGEPGGALRAATVFVLGYPDPMFGRGLKETGGSVSWARLVAASGLVGVTYSYRDPVSDLGALLTYLRSNAEVLGIDRSRMAVWSCSGNVPTALSLLMQEASDAFRCAVLNYGFMLDTGDSTYVADAAARFGFANPCAGRSVGDLPAELPLLIVRAGRDEMPYLNETIDSFVAGALARNLPVTLVNHASAPHAFDLWDDSETSREVIRQILAFLCLHLLA